MRRSTSSQFISGTAAMLLCLFAAAPSGVSAAEFGEIRTSSYIGQPLEVDIELTALTTDELAGLRARLASPDVYRGASIAMNPVLDTVDMSIVKRGARQFLHVTSIKRIDSNYLHLFVEFTSGARQSVRIATVTLGRDPAPPPPPPPKVAAPAFVMPLEPVMPARLKPVAVTPAAAKPLPKPAPPVVVAPPPPKPKPAPAPKIVEAPACKPQAPLRPSRECAALDVTNATNVANVTLTAKLVDLEAKVKVLQQALGVQVASAPVSADKPGLAPTPLASKPLALKPAAKTRAKPAAAPGNNLLWIGLGTAGLLLLIALGVYLLRKRNKDNKYWVLLRKPFSRKKPEAQRREPEPPELTEQA